MAYDILSDDLFDDSDGKPNGRKRKKSKRDYVGGGSKDKEGFNYVGLLIHLGILILIVLVLFGIYMWVFGDDDSNVSSGDGYISLVGSLDNFNESYNSTSLMVKSSKFTILTENGKFSENSKDIEIKDFSGYIYEFNESITLSGSASSIEYGKNEINTAGSNFKLISEKKTTVDLYFDEIRFDFVNGKIRFNDVLNFDFVDSLIDINNFNFTLIYDGKFSLNGKSSSFNMNSTEDSLTIKYG